MAENPYEYERKQKRKIIIVTAIMVAIIIFLLAWVVVVAINNANKRSANNNNNEATTSVVDTKSGNSETKAQEPSDSNTAKPNNPTTIPDNGSQTSDKKSTDKSSSDTKSTTTTPTTGPMDTTLTALLAGVSVFLATNLLMSHRSFKKANNGVL